MTSSGIEFRVLGPLDVLVDGAPVTLGGAKQRAVLAALLLNPNEVISVERLVDEVWGDDPPPSAAHSLESYVSRLRQLLTTHGPALVRRGAGYVLDLRGARLDSGDFLDLHESASLAASVDEPETVVELTTAALAIWRGPALADVALASAGRAQAERLEELRLHTYELRLDAELRLGRHERVVSELQPLVGQNPYRERFVAQLMLALYRSGRHAEALDVYERTRRRLDEDLGLQPSLELQQLSGQIVRQDAELRRPRTGGVRKPSSRETAAPRRARRLTGLIAAGAVIASTMAFTASGSGAVASDPSQGKPRVALVQPAEQDRPWVPGENAASFRRAATSWGDAPEVFEVDEHREDVERVRGRVADGRFELVVVLSNDDVVRAVRPLVTRLPDTTFVFVDVSLADIGLAGVTNASAIRMRNEQSSELAGYLSALVRPKAARGEERVDAVSVVAGASLRERRAVRGFVRGVKAARSGVRVRIAYTRDTDDVTACERIANTQVDAGADVVFAAAGRCGRGAVAVARARGVWGVGSMDDGIWPGDGVLAVTTSDYGRALFRAVTSYHLRQLPAGADDAFGLEDDYAVLIEVNSIVPEAIWSKVVAHCTEIRLAAAA